MKICVMGHYPSNKKKYAGVSRVVYNLVHEISIANNEVVILKKKRYSQLFKKIECTKEENLLICNVSHIGLIPHLIKNKYQLINIHSMSFFYVIPMFLKKFRLIHSKIVFVSHGIVALEKKEKRYNYPLRYQLYQKISFSWSNHIIAVSSYLKDSICEYYGIDEEKISVIGNAVDKNFFKETDLSASIVVPDEYALFVGEITPIKGLDFLLEALLKVDIPLVLIGKRTPYYDEIRERYFSLFESGKVLHFEVLEEAELLRIYSNCLFCVLPSRHEPFGLVVLEAMAAGKPVIVTNQVGAKEIIENGKEGFIVPYGDVDRLSESMSYLIVNRDETQRIGMFAKEKALKNTWEIKAKEYCKLFKKIVDTTTNK